MKKRACAPECFSLFHFTKIFIHKLYLPLHLIWQSTKIVLMWAYCFGWRLYYQWKTAWNGILHRTTSLGPTICQIFKLFSLLFTFCAEITSRILILLTHTQTIKHLWYFFSIYKVKCLSILHNLWGDLTYCFEWRLSDLQITLEYVYHTS